MHKTLLLLIFAIGTLNGIFAQAPDTLIAEPAGFEGYNPQSKERLDALSATVPLPYNEHVQKYIDNYTVKHKAMISKMLGLATYYFPVFEKALAAYNLPDELKYLTIVESSLDPRAVSKSGAGGLWQFMPGTAKGYGLSISKYEDHRNDPEKASFAAANYLKDAFKELEDWQLAIAGYNCGTGEVRRAIQKAGSRDYWEIRHLLPLQTQKYVPAFIAAVYSMKYAASHEILPKQHNLPNEVDTFMVNRMVALADIARAGDLDEAMLTVLNPVYSKKIVAGTADSPKKLLLPVKHTNFERIYDLLYGGDTQVDKPVNVAERRLHQVRSGQNLGQIASTYRVSVDSLKKANKLKSDAISVGQKLKIPDNNGR